MVKTIGSVGTIGESPVKTVGEVRAIGAAAREPRRRVRRRMGVDREEVIEKRARKKRAEPEPEPSEAEVAPEAEGFKMRAVTSSNVAAIGYDKASLTLQVRFLNGSLYHYHEVPVKLWNRFRRARSKGKFIWKNLRDVFPYTRIE